MGKLPKFYHFIAGFFNTGNSIQDNIHTNMPQLDKSKLNFGNTSRKFAKWASRFSGRFMNHIKSHWLCWTEECGESKCQNISIWKFFMQPRNPSVTILFQLMPHLLKNLQAQGIVTGCCAVDLSLCFSRYIFEKQLKRFLEFPRYI